MLHQPVDQAVCVISPVDKESIRVDPFQKLLCQSDIGILTRCDIEFHRVAQSIAGRIVLSTIMYSLS
ncbi:hypothetical protein KOEU_29090 [Komagataeibacter europaeus]|uniref:Uncharacterized protein n=1 Tax=Komagataeibacter europaeus TaxID=33995 RepID=A0A0M0EEB6_KOMEU|nr:hypothetical protein KOEU_29090 [Komagataeibacter europaeus]